MQPSAVHSIRQRGSVAERSRWKTPGRAPGGAAPQSRGLGRAQPALGFPAASGGSHVLSEPGSSCLGVEYPVFVLPGRLPRRLGGSRDEVCDVKQRLLGKEREFNNGHPAPRPSLQDRSFCWHLSTALGCVQCIF